MKPITFIIPCAGKATRLGIPFCKEMFPIEKEKTLIDVVFQNLEQFKEKCQIIIIISKEKTELVKYLSKYSDEFDITFIYQKSKYKELIGAIKSVEYLFSEKNILILPDIFIKDKNINEKFKKYIHNLNYTDISYLLVKEENKEILSRVGNIIVEDNKIVNAIDKPNIETINRLNSKHYWVSIGFSFQYKDSFFKYFEALQSKKEIIYENIKKESLITDFVEIDFALDLGVWDNIYEFYKRNKGEEHEN